METRITTAAILIQKTWRGYIFRRKTIPNSLLAIQKYLDNIEIKCSTDTDDGRLNSCFDEITCIDLLKRQFKGRIRKPEKRKWYDVLVKDHRHNWLPCNIKSTTMKSSDNTGNLAMCVYSYTNHSMSVFNQYNNGKMSAVLFNSISNKQYNLTARDYYFIVINKDTNKVIINSCKGLTTLTPNSNNLPFQVCWNKNKKYKYYPITEVVAKFIRTINAPRPSWKESFLSNMRSLNINE
jgi:hypothetical protein